MKLEIGQVVHHFVVERVLGSGGTAVVYLVRDRTRGTCHALKVLSVSSPAIRERMRREGEVQSALQHPNIVPVQDVIDLDGSPALVMEFVEGPTLDAALRRYRLTLQDAELLFGGILNGVHAAHASGLVHRDLKPANVLLASTVEGFVPKVTDFGLAKILIEIPGLAHTRQGISMGTPSYMAPEQIRDAGSVDIRADLWSLGCLLYELMTRRRAFPGDEALAIYNAVVDASFTPPRQWMPELPDRVNDAILGCLQLDPGDRIPDCQTLLEVLQGGREWHAQTSVVRRRPKPWADDESTADPLDHNLPASFSTDGPDRPIAGVGVHQPTQADELVIEAMGDDTLPELTRGTGGLSEDDLVVDGSTAPPIAVVRADTTAGLGSAAFDDEEETVAVRLTELVPSGRLRADGSGEAGAARRPGVSGVSGELPPRLGVRRPRAPSVDPVPAGPRSPRTRAPAAPMVVGLGAAALLFFAFVIGASASVVGFVLADDRSSATLESPGTAPADELDAARTPPREPPVPARAVEIDDPPPRRRAVVRPDPAPVAVPAEIAEAPPRVIDARPPQVPARPPDLSPEPPPIGAPSPAGAVPAKVVASGPPIEVRFLSVEWGAEVFIDGKRVEGRTPARAALRPGDYDVRMVSGENVGTFKVSVGPEAQLFCYQFDERRLYDGRCP